MNNKFYLLAFFCLLLNACKNESEGLSESLVTGKDWPVYGGNKAGNRYSPLQQINSSNVKNLKVAWIYDAREPVDSANPNQRPKEIQCQPIVVDGIMYGTTPEVKLFAIDAATGKELWKFVPEKHNQSFASNRGVMFWRNGNDTRILFSSGSNLYAINAKDGKPIQTFGNGGKADLHEGLATGLDHEVKDLSVSASTPGVIYKNIVIMGSSVSEGGDAAPGHIRAFDVVSGKLKWVFHTIPQPGELGYDTWPKDAYKKIGAANNWSGLVVDEKRGVVFFGTGSPASDFYGGDRKGANLFANCIMALDAETGKMKWYFQTTRHDLWDRDHPCQPNLTTVTRNGKKLDVVAQVTKDGLVYVLNRDTGESLYPVEEHPAPVKGLPGEHPYPTQISPVKPLPLTRQIFTEDDITNISPGAHAFVKQRWLEFGLMPSKYEPPSVKGTLLHGYSGGAEWGGNATDPGGILYQNANEDFWELMMVDQETRNKELANVSPGQALYMRNCAVCHGADRKGSGSVFPSLVNIGNKRSPAAINTILKTGIGRMPSFKHLSEVERNTVTGFLLNKEKKVAKPTDKHSTADTIAREKNFPYRPLYVSKTWRKFL
ncbi:MAG TPA: c-type cytochrome, partial [Chitinophagaceae bacterium]|nr:c-type cytochrome [Chitinophagaceae bacterium]